jgi:hypothetical protein
MLPRIELFLLTKIALFRTICANDAFARRPAIEFISLNNKNVGAASTEHMQTPDFTLTGREECTSSSPILD